MMGGRPCCDIYYPNHERITSHSDVASKFSWELTKLLGTEINGITYKPVVSGGIITFILLV